MNRQINLNEEQKAASEHPIDEAGCVIAGAGTGKTRVLMARIQHLINNGVNPKRVLCITFTNKSAQEIRDRLNLDPKDPNCPRISTIHGLALSAIQKDPRGFGLNERISILDDYGQTELLKDVIEKLGWIEKVKYWDMKEKIQYHRARGMGFSRDYTPEVHERILKVHSGYHALNEDELKVWDKYEKEKTAQSVVDFDDMIHLVVDRGLRDPKWKKIIGSVFHHILIDESQDVNIVQWAFINLLIQEGNRNIFVVGDISQSIYGFTGASPEMLYEFSQNWRGKQPKLYKLQENYRSVPQIVKLANVIQKRMTDTIPLKMESFRGNKGDSGFIRLMNEYTPQEIANKIASQIWNYNVNVYEKVAYRDNCILVRSATQIRDIENELVKARVPYVIRGGKSLLQSEEARDLLSYMRLLVNPRDVQAFSRSIGIPKRGIGDVTINKVVDLAKDKHQGDLIQAVKAYNHAKMGMYIVFLEELEACRVSVLDCYDLVIKNTKYLDHIKEKYRKDQDKVEWKTANVFRIREIIESLVDSNPAIALEDIVFQMTMNDKNEEAQEEAEDGKVTISTIHSSKGIEWKKVYITNLNEQSLPHKFCVTPKEIEEERRLWYVAVTRARDELILCVPMTQSRGESYTSLRPSRFLTEVGLITGYEAGI